MPDFKPILNQVLQEITPEKDNPAYALAKKFLKEVNNELKRKKISAKAVFGGSFAKDTWLKGDYDIDVFVKFALKHRGQDLSNLLEKALKKWEYERVPGSRDYFWIKQDKMKYEIVPVLAIKKEEQAENVTDFSPMHVEWVNKKGKKYKDDIRLAKKFFKAQGVYGAESYIRGFSGHVADILVIYYRGFLNLLKAAAKWKPKEIIDYYHIYDKKVFLRLNKSKIQGPLVVIDPLQKDRNAAAAVGINKFNALITAAKKFLKKPDRHFFVETEVDLGKLEKKGKLLHLYVTAKKAREDILGNRFLQAFEFLKKKLEEFDIITSGWRWKRNANAEFWYVLGKELLPPTKIQEGPPAKMKEAVKKFRKKHKNTFVRNSRVMAKLRRHIRTPEQAARQALKEEYIKSRKINAVIK